jgi:TrmH family RNA methyltransferase
MTASHDDASKPSGGDFDLPGFKAKPRKKAAESSPGAAEDKPLRPAKPFSPPSGPKRTGQLPTGFKGGERKDRPDAPRGPRKPFQPGDAPRKKFEGDFRPSREGGRGGDRPSRSYGDKPARKPYGSDSAPRKPYGGDSAPRKPLYGADRSADRGPRPYSGDRPARPYGDKPAWKSDGPRKPHGSDRGPGGDRPSRPYGDKPAWKSDGPRKPYGSDRGGAPGGAPRKPYGSDRGGDRGGKPAWKSDGPRKSFGGGGYPGSRDATVARPFEPELSPDVKKFLPLLTEKGRHKESRFLLEGAKNIADVAEHSPEILHIVLVAEGFEDTALKDRLDALRVRTRMVAASDISALCGTETPQGIVAVANFGSLRPDWTTINTVTLLDGVQDPGNLGAILRTSAALGMDAVVLGKGTCDPYNPKVVRASAASLLRMPLETGEDLATKIHFLRLKGFTIVATSPHAKITLDQAKLRRKVALLFGNEGGGVGANLIDQADQVVRIPMKGSVESLNVAVAHGLLAYDLTRLKR